MKDAHNGTDRWQAPLPADAPNAHRTIVSAGSPTIVHVEATPQGAAPIDDYFAFSDTGQLQATVNGIGAFGRLEPLVGPSGLQHQVAHVSGNILVEPTAAKDPSSGNPPAAGLVAFDLATGKQLWQAPALTGNPVAVVALDQDKTIVFDGGVTETGPGARLLAYSTANGAPATSPIKDALGQDWAGPATAYLVGDRLVVVPAWPRKGAAVVAFEVKQ
jgi:outer membrane protein assembly factor BamB